MQNDLVEYGLFFVSLGFGTLLFSLSWILLNRVC